MIFSYGIFTRDTVLMEGFFPGERQRAQGVGDGAAGGGEDGGEERGGLARGPGRPHHAPRPRQARLARLGRRPRRAQGQGGAAA